MRAPQIWISGHRRMRIARRVLYTAMVCSVSIIVFVSSEDRGSTLALAGELVLALLVANLALVVWEVRMLSAGLEEAGLERSQPAQAALARAIRRMVGVLVVMLAAGSALMLWAARLLPQDTTGEYALLFWVLLASGFALSVYVAELITHLIHAFESALLHLSDNNGGGEEDEDADPVGNAAQAAGPESRLTPPSGAEADARSGQGVKDQLGP